MEYNTTSSVGKLILCFCRNGKVRNYLKKNSKKTHNSFVTTESYFILCGLTRQTSIQTQAKNTEYVNELRR